MARYLPAIEREIRELLRDELGASGEAGLEFKTSEVKRHIRQILSRISQDHPYKSKESLTTTENSRQLDISDITNRIRIIEIEYPADLTPRNLYNFDWIDEDTIEVRTDRLFGDAETIYVYCEKAHTLEEDSSTLSYQLEELLIKGAAGSLAVAVGREMIDQVNTGGGASPQQMIAWGQMMLTAFEQGLVRHTPPNQKKNWPVD